MSLGRAADASVEQARVTASPTVAETAQNPPPAQDAPPPRRPVAVDALLAIGRSVSALPIVSGLAIVAALWWAQAVLIPVVVAVLVSYALEPLIAGLERWHVQRPFAAPLVLTMLLAAAATGAYALRGEAVAFVNRLPGAAHAVAQVIQTATRGAPGTMARVEQAARELETAARGATRKDQPDGVTPVRIEGWTFRWSEWLWQESSGALGFAWQMLVVLCLVYYLLAAGNLYRRKLVRMVPTLSDKKVTLQILAEIDRQIERFLLARIAISAIVGVLIWASFRVFGLEDAGVWGVLSAVLFVIPIAGPTVVVLGAAVAGLVHFHSLGMATAVGGVCAAIGALEANILTPWLMSRVGEMNAVAVFVSLLFWGWIWGLWGLLLAVPITAALKAVCERIDGLQAYAELLKEDPRKDTTHQRSGHESR